MRLPSLEVQGRSDSGYAVGDHFVDLNKMIAAGVATKPALLRAAKQARLTALATNTPLVIYRNGKTVRLSMVKEKRARYGN
jgi:hypothetical protein